MLTIEYVASYSRGLGYAYQTDHECSIPERETTEEAARQWMELLERGGWKRRETETQIFYEMVVDSTHVNEWIFRNR